MVFVTDTGLGRALTACQMEVIRPSKKTNARIVHIPIAELMRSVITAPVIPDSVAAVVVSRKCCRMKKKNRKETAAPLSAVR